MSNSRPVARTEHTHVEELDGGLVIYDGACDQAHWLDAQSTRVWRSADGTRTATRIAHATGLPEACVTEALEQLASRGLLHETAVSRRGMLRRTAVASGLALAAVPVIETVFVPAAAAAASTATGGGTGTGGGPPMTLSASIVYNPAASPGVFGATVTIYTGDTGVYQMPADNTGKIYYTDKAPGKETQLLVRLLPSNSPGTFGLYLSRYSGPDVYTVVVAGSPGKYYASGTADGTYTMPPGLAEFTFGPTTRVDIYTNA